MKRRKYKFTDKNHSVQGVVSSIIGIVCILAVVGILAVAYQQSGQTGKWIAIPGIVVLLLAVTGMYYGILGTKEENTYRLFPWLGCGINGIVLAAFVLIYILGW
ncbi:MAG: hypothetical protein IKV59_05150 [Lachnospiraceae bacterium]|nr:hypothetical protein [Lachnospiraceae bacterium]